MVQLRKSILKVGTHHSPDGKVEVTPSRLQHWQATFAKMKAAGAVIPIDWDHAQDVNTAVPLSLADYQRHRSAKNTVGKLADFQVSRDGQSAEIVLEVEDDGALTKAEKNLVYVSPVIFPEWTDGAGNRFNDCITHVDFVNHPVDQRQTPFRPTDNHALACAIRLGLSKPYRMAADMTDDPIKDDLDEPTVEEVTDDEPTLPENPDLPTEQADNPQMEAILAHLTKLGIRLPSDTTSGNFMERFLPALMTAVEMDQPEAQNEPEEEPVTETPTVADPAIAAMSLQARNALAYAERTNRDSIRRDIDTLLRDGRCTPNEAKDKVASLSGVRLSLDRQGNPNPSKLEDWITSRKPLPRGTFWNDEKKTRMSAQPAEAPNGWETTSRAETPEDADKAADFVFGKR